MNVGGWLPPKKSEVLVMDEKNVKLYAPIVETVWGVLVVIGAFAGFLLA